jgi:hypothetical protein
MKALLCIVVFIVPASTGVQEDQFLSCVQLSGAPYRQARDAWLADPDRSLLEQKLKDPDWLQRAQAMILLGWLANGKYYEELLHDTPSSDRAGQPHYSWYRTQRLRAEAVPLLYELILKGGAHKNAESDAAAALVTLADGDTPVDTATFLSLLDDPRITSIETRRIAAMVLAKLSSRSENLDLELLVKLLVSEQDETMRRLLLEALASVSSHRSASDRDRLVNRLEAQEQIPALVGPEALIHAIARIGGAEAARQVTSYLESTSDLTQQRWALHALSRMPEKSATDIVVKYARVPTAPSDMRLGAIGALANCPYSDEVNEALDAIARNPEQSLGERREAIKVLDQVHVKRVDQGGDASDLTSRILRLEADRLGDERLDADLKTVGQRVRERISR